MSEPSGGAHRHAKVRVEEPLRLFLPSRFRASGVAPVLRGGHETAGHLVQSAGVPLTEVGPLVDDGARIDVAPIRRPQRLPEPRFVLDVHLGTLARRLRVLGLDVAYRNDAGDDELVTQALEQRRVLLTQDRGLLFRRALHADHSSQPRAAYVYGTRPADQLADVLDRFAPPLAPFTRCTRCGGPLVPVSKAEVLDQLQPGTRRSYDEFARCVACGQVYWHGAHGRRLDAVVVTASMCGTRSWSTSENA